MDRLVVAVCRDVTRVGSSPAVGVADGAQIACELAVDLVLAGTRRVEMQGAGVEAEVSVAESCRSHASLKLQSGERLQPSFVQLNGTGFVAWWLLKLDIGSCRYPRPIF